MQRRVVLERLPYREEGVVARVLRNVSESGRHMMRGDLFPEPRNRSLVRTEESGEAQKQSRFARPWPADDADDLSIANIETNITESRR